MRLPGQFTFALSLLTLVLTVGCSGTPPTRNYVLDSVAVEPLEKRGAAEPVAVSVGPVSIPGYLDRPQMVTRQSENQLQIASADRWAESLQAGVSRVLMENLSILLGDGNVNILPWSGSQPSDCRVAVDVIRLDGQLGGELVLKARWHITSEGQGGAQLSEASRITAPVPGKEYEDFAAAASEALGRLSQAIASDVQDAVETRM